MILNSFKTLFERDIEKVKKELSLYRAESNLWLVDQEIKNSGGNLCLHLIGNLKTFLGQGLAGVEYQRDREFEFNGSGVSREELMKGLDEAKEVVAKGLSNLSSDDLEKNFPIVIWEKETNMSLTILHLHAHLNYHLGQLNYHRRLLDK